MNKKFEQWVSNKERVENPDLISYRAEDQYADITYHNCVGPHIVDKVARALVGHNFRVKEINIEEKGFDTVITLRINDIDRCIIGAHNGSTPRGHEDEQEI